jgi:hypothetical protein
MESRALQVRRYPYPYRAVLAICSDLDETSDRDIYYELMRFLNTDKSTSMGPGMALEVGNSIYFDMPPNQFAYWTTDDKGREMVRALIRSGHIDCLHSFGDLATTRKDAAQALEELERHGCQLQVWVDHGAVPTNFGPDIMYGHGDEPGHPAYHADLTMSHGVRYVWRGRVTSVIGQDQPHSLQGIWHPGHPFTSSKTVLKEAAKHLLWQRQNGKYTLHRYNHTLYPSRLRDGHLVYEFLRCNPHWGGVSSCETGWGIGQVLTPAFLRRLVDRQGTCILYTHLGKLGSNGAERRFGQSALRAFELLADFSRRGHILVTTTRRLLDYLRVRDEITAVMSENGPQRIIDLKASTESQYNDRLRAEEVQGLTFYLTDPQYAKVRLNNAVFLSVNVNGPDHTGRPSISVPWRRLEFPEL